MLDALGLFVVIEVVGLAAAPLAALVLGRLPGAGLGFSKLLGLLLVTWLIWMAASLGIAPGAFRVRFHRARRSLEKHLAAGGHEEVMEATSNSPQPESRR